MRRLLALTALATLALALPAHAAKPGRADLQIAKTGPAEAVVGSTVTYSIAVENLGPLPASGVVVTDSLPRGTRLVAANPSVGRCSQKGRTVRCSIGALEAGQYAVTTGATVAIALVPEKPGTITNRASVSAATDDPISGNNRASVATRIVEAPKPVFCRGQVANVVGTPGPDNLVGTPGRDVIAGFGGADLITSRGGRDLICAAGGADVVNAGPAADRVFGGRGNDRLFGRRGPDGLFGGPGFDRCKGGPGINIIRNCERR